MEFAFIAVNSARINTGHENAGLVGLVSSNLPIIPIDDAVFGQGRPCRPTKQVTGQHPGSLGRPASAPRVLAEWV